MTRHTLTDEQWDLVEPFIPLSTATTGRPANDRRLMLDGIFWILAAGTPWRDLPDCFGPFQSVHRYFSTWRKNGVFAAIVETLQLELDKDGLIDWELWCVDGSNVRAARCAAGASKKVSRRTPTSRPTTRWAAAGAGSARSSTSSPTARARPWRSR
jgi:transposase